MATKLIKVVSNVEVRINRHLVSTKPVVIHTHGACWLAFQQRKINAIWGEWNDKHIKDKVTVTMRNQKTSTGKCIVCEAVGKSLTQRLKNAKTA